MKPFLIGIITKFKACSLGAQAAICIGSAGVVGGAIATPIIIANNTNQPAPVIEESTTEEDPSAGEIGKGGDKEDEPATDEPQKPAEPQTPVTPKKTYPKCEEKGETSGVCIWSVINDDPTGAKSATSQVGSDLANYWYFKLNGKIYSGEDALGSVAPPNINRLRIFTWELTDLAVEVDNPPRHEAGTFVNVIPAAYADYVNGKWVVKWEVVVTEWKWSDSINPTTNSNDTVIVYKSTDSNGYAHGKQYLTSASQKAIDQALVKYEQELNKYQNLYDTIYLPWLNQH